MNMININFGLLFVRLGLGVCLLMHGIFKLTHGIDGVKSMLVARGIPSGGLWRICRRGVGARDDNHRRILPHRRSACDRKRAHDNIRPTYSVECAYRRGRI